jgi:hypothetical protein
VRDERAWGVLSWDGLFCGDDGGVRGECAGGEIAWGWVGVFGAGSGWVEPVLSGGFQWGEWAERAGHL